MSYVHVFIFTRETQVTIPEDFERLLQEKKGERVKFLGYIPTPPWKDSALVGKRMVFKMQRHVGSFYTAEELNAAGYGIEKIYTRETLREIGNTIDGLHIEVD